MGSSGWSWNYGFNNHHSMTPRPHYLHFNNGYNDYRNPHQHNGYKYNHNYYNHHNYNSAINGGVSVYCHQYNRYNHGHCNTYEAHYGSGQYYDEEDDYNDEFEEFDDEFEEYEYNDEDDDCYDYYNRYNDDHYKKREKARNKKAVQQADSRLKSNLILAPVPSYSADYMSPYSGRIWDEAELLALSERVSLLVAQTFIKLLNDGCTLPFIARYRKDSVNYLRPDRLHELHESYQRVSHLKKKVTTVLDTLKKSSKLTEEVETSILNARTHADLDLVYAPLKTQAISLVEKARKLGLDKYANKALKGDKIDLKSLCTSDEERSTVDNVEAHITHLIADIIHKDTRVLKKIKKLKYENEFTIQSKQNEDSLKKKKTNDKTKYNTKTDPETYQIYFDWSCNSQVVKPHQTLALNRGENKNILTVEVIVPNLFYSELERLCLTLWSGNIWVRKGLKDAYNRFILPWLIRQVRSDLTNKAWKGAVKTFTANLETYLLTEPVKNMRIAGLDPGFKHGCKVGVIETTGEKLAASAIFPDLNKYIKYDKAAAKLKDMLHNYDVTLIGLGNGTACRETEKWLKDHDINIPVIIVPEQGASVYSISKEAQNEHPNMDPNLISALSIARRVLDPLGELIKVEPKNLGVGIFATKIRVNVNQISHPNFPQMVEKNMKVFNIKQMSQELGTDESNLQLIISAFKQRSKEDEDNFIHFCKPVYSLVMHDSELTEGVNLTSVVRNVVPFGCFVDCGVGDNGLIHCSQYGGNQTPKLGDRVSVTVIAPPKPKKLQLRLDKILDQ